MIADPLPFHTEQSGTFEVAVDKAVMDGGESSLASQVVLAMLRNPRTRKRL